MTITYLKSHNYIAELIKDGQHWICTTYRCINQYLAYKPMQCTIYEPCLKKKSVINLGTTRNGQIIYLFSTCDCQYRSYLVLIKAHWKVTFSFECGKDGVYHPASHTLSLCPLHQVNVEMGGKVRLKWCRQVECWAVHFVQLLLKQLHIRREGRLALSKYLKVWMHMVSMPLKMEGEIILEKRLDVKQN